MQQHMVILLAFLVGLFLLQEEGHSASPLWVTAAVVGVYLGVAGGLSRLNTALSLRAFARHERFPPSAARRHNLLKHLTHVWLIAGLGVVIAAGYGHLIVDVLRAETIPLAGKLLVVLPFVLGLILHWTQEYPFHRALHQRIARQQQLVGSGATCGTWRRAEHLAYNIRHQLLFIFVPVGLIILIQDVLVLYGPSVLGDVPHREEILAAAALAAAGGVFFFAPLLIVRIWRTNKLPEGPLRAQLERMCTRLGLRFRDILIWRSGNVIANAGVMGLSGSVRYVLLSDLLLERMRDEQVKAVFAHEAGHVICHHILYMAVFAISSALLAVSTGGVGAAVLGLAPRDGDIAAMVLLGAAWAVGFGWMSRRLERQSDVIAAWASGPDGGGDEGTISAEGAAIFASALQRVAQLNGIGGSQRSWRHGSITSRVNYIFHLSATGATRSRIDRVVRRIKLGVWVALAAGVAMTAVWIFAIE